MSALGTVLTNLKKVLLIEDKVGRLEAETRALGRKVEDHENRLVRIETLIEITGGGRIGRLPPR